MAGHLQPDAVSLAASGHLDAELREHLLGCAECRAAVELASSDETRRERPSALVAEDSGTSTQEQVAAGELGLRQAQAERMPLGLSEVEAAAEPDGPIPWDDDPEMQQSEDDDAPAAPPPSKRGVTQGQSISRYVILSQLGQGGMGVVFAAYDQELDRKIAVKLLRPGRSADGHERLLREAQAMARISHPNVLPVFDVGVHQDQVFVAMELVEGGSLKDWIKKGQHTWRETLQLFIAAGRGLAAAHEAGLVHRDFKPDNVLVGKDGRVFVTDFGLARMVSDTRPDVPAADEVDAGTRTGSRLSSPLTQAGMVMGTPAYMAPEQYLGPTADARTDEFAFCAALYWALWKKRPFDPQRIAIAAAQMGDESTKTATRRLSGARRSLDAELVREPPGQPPGQPKIPAWLRAAVLKGLALRAEDRYPSMDALLSELERRVAVTRRGVWAAAGAALVLAAAVGVVGVRQAQARAEVCSGGPRMLQGVWDPSVRGALEKTFAVFPGSEDQLQRVEGVLDAYARSWTDAHRSACEAVRVRQEQPEKVLALRMACLDRRLEELRGLTGLLVTADAKLVQQSADAAQQLSSVRPCANVAALLEKAPLPDDPGVRAKIDAVFKQLSDANAIRFTGRFPDALKKVVAAWTEAEPLRYRPLEAETLYLRGVLEGRTGSAKEAEVTLLGAFDAADAGRDDSLKSQIATRMAQMMSEQSRFAEARRWIRAARSAVERLGGNRELEAEILAYEGTMLVGEGRYEDAVAALQQSLKMTSLELGKDNLRRLGILGATANALAHAGRNAEAIPMLEEVLRETERIRGPGHPAQFTALYSLAYALTEERRFVEAHARADAALELAKARFGATHLRVPQTLELKATIFQTEGRFEEALGTYRAALAIKEQTLAKDSAELSFALDGIGQCLNGKGSYAEAVPWFEKALAVRGPDPVGLAETRFGLAKALWASRTGTRDRERAHALAEQALENYRSVGRSKDADAIAKWLAAPR